jgi:GntR family transcriptional regulator, trigonelline degradation regulator
LLNYYIHIYTLVDGWPPGRGWITGAASKNMDELPPRLRVNTVAETIRGRTLETLRDAICNLHFQPGQRLVERELCEKTGVSRTTIREALRHLESEGLVEIVPRKGPVVATLSATDASQLYEVRGALERLSGKLFARRATTKDIAQLESAIKRLRKATAERDLKTALMANEDFYNIIFERCGNPVAKALYKMMRARVTLLRARATAQWDRQNNQASLARMAAIVEAFKKKDPELAQSLLEEHAAKSTETMLAILDSNEKPEAGAFSD